MHHSVKVHVRRLLALGYDSLEYFIFYIPLNTFGFGHITWPILHLFTFEFNGSSRAPAHGPGPNESNADEFVQYDWSAVGARYGASTHLLASYYRCVLKKTRNLEVDVSLEVYTVKSRVQSTRGGIEIVGLAANEAHTGYNVYIKRQIDNNIDTVVDFYIPCDGVARSFAFKHEEPCFEISSAQKLKSINPGHIIVTM